MKTFATISMLFLLPFFSTAQSRLMPTQAVKNVMKDVRMGMSLKDFKRSHPKAELDKNASSDTRIEWLEHPDDGIKEITYYFMRGDNSPFYEVIIEMESEDTREKVAADIFGTFNHPAKEKHWVIYNGKNDFLTVGWIYEAKVIFAGNVPGNPFENDDMFKVPSDFKKTDMRLCKNSNSKPAKEDDDDVQPIVKKEEVKPDDSKNEGNGTATVEDYGKAIEAFLETRIKLELAADSVLILYPDAVKKPQTLDYREEYVCTINNNGLKRVSVMTTKGDKGVVYELVFEFDNADSTLAATEGQLTGIPKHPTLDNHWVMFVGDKTSEDYRLVDMAWVYENKLIIGGNLLNSEFEKEEDFKLTDEYVEKWNKEVKGGGKGNEPTPNGNPEKEESITNQINAFVDNADTDFEKLKGTELGNNKFDSQIRYEGAEKTILRKNTNGNWRLEATFAPTSFEDANAIYNEQRATITKLEGLTHRLVKKTETGGTTGRAIVWDVQTLDDVSTGVIMKLQTYKTSTGSFAVKLEIGK